MSKDRLGVAPGHWVHREPTPHGEPTVRLAIVPASNSRNPVAGRVAGLSNSARPNRANSGPRKVARFQSARTSVSCAYPSYVFLPMWSAQSRAYDSDAVWTPKALPCGHRKAISVSLGPTWGIGPRCPDRPSPLGTPLAIYQVSSRRTTLLDEAIEVRSGPGQRRSTAAGSCWR